MSKLKSSMDQNYYNTHFGPAPKKQSSAGRARDGVGVRGGATSLNAEPRDLDT